MGGGVHQILFMQKCCAYMRKRAPFVLYVYIYIYIYIYIYVSIYGHTEIYVHMYYVWLYISSHMDYVYSLGRFHYFISLEWISSYTF